MSAKDDMMAQVRKKAEKIREHKDRSLGLVKPARTVADFIETVEKARVESAGGLEFTSQVDMAYAMMVHRLRRFDSAVFVEIVWDKEEKCEEWKDLRPSAVRIQWSEAYIRSHPGCDAEVTISADQLWLLGDEG